MTVTCPKLAAPGLTKSPIRPASTGEDARTRCHGTLPKPVRDRPFPPELEAEIGRRREPGDRLIGQVRDFDLNQTAARAWVT